MSRLRLPENKDAKIPQPHKPDRDKDQPYSKEREEYSGGGVVRPPEEEVDKRGRPSPPSKP